MNSGEQVQRITVKVQELLKKYEGLLKENERLRNELVPAKQREAGFLEMIESLQQQVMILKAGTGKLDEADKRELDKKLHIYLKEIDRCISMLSE